MGSPGHWRVGHGMGSLFPVHLGGKRRFKGLKTKMSRKSMRFCKLWPSLGCVLLTVKYGSNAAGLIDLSYSKEEPGNQHVCGTLPT